MSRFLLMPLAISLVFVSLFSPVVAQGNGTQDEYGQLVRKAAEVLRNMTMQEQSEFRRSFDGLSSREEKVIYLRNFLKQRKGANPALPNMQNMMQDTMRRVQNMSPKERAQMLEGVRDMYKNMPPEQRRMIMDQLKKGGMDKLKQVLEQSPLGNKDGEPSRIQKTVEQVQQMAQEFRRYYDSYQNMPEEQRRRLMEDALEGVQIYFEDMILPEIEQQLARFERRLKKNSEKFEKFMKLPENKRMDAFRGELEQTALRAWDSLPPQIQDQLGDRVRDFLKKIGRSKGPKRGDASFFNFEDHNNRHRGDRSRWTNRSRGSNRGDWRRGSDEREREIRRRVAGFLRKLADRIDPESSHRGRKEDHRGGHSWDRDRQRHGGQDLEELHRRAFDRNMGPKERDQMMERLRRMRERLKDADPQERREMLEKIHRGMREREHGDMDRDDRRKRPDNRKDAPRKKRSGRRGDA
ncbi:MAG: hypothetical protein QF752_01570 [Planctomycetota bacterium]|jgi:hypothetical protein|nr:hypothetical protein [Planctomycetota bacterium]